MLAPFQLNWNSPLEKTWVSIALRSKTARPLLFATALKVAYGVTQVGKFPEMVQRGVNVSIGTDGNNASNYSDLMRATYLVAGLFKDARVDAQMFPAEKAYEMATLGGARSMGLQDQIGSIEVGKRADVVLHDALPGAGQQDAAVCQSAGIRAAARMAARKIRASGMAS